QRRAGSYVPKKHTVRVRNGEQAAVGIDGNTIHAAFRHREGIAQRLVVCYIPEKDRRTLIPRQHLAIAAEGYVLDCLLSQRLFHEPAVGDIPENYAVRSCDSGQATVGAGSDTIHTVICPYRRHLCPC